MQHYILNVHKFNYNFIICHIALIIHFLYIIVDSTFIYIWFKANDWCFEVMVYLINGSYSFKITFLFEIYGTMCLDTLSECNAKWKWSTRYCFVDQIHFVIVSCILLYIYNKCIMIAPVSCINTLYKTTAYAKSEIYFHL